MTSYISHTTVDCAHAYELSQWWKEVLGYVDIPDDPNEPGHPECMIQSPEADHQLLFIEVPDTKTVKNRIHFDLRPSAGTRDEEVERLVALGATVVADHSDIHGPGIGWVTMADPEGNEFCVLRSEAEIQATTASRTRGRGSQPRARGAPAARPPRCPRRSPRPPRRGRSRSP